MTNPYVDNDKPPRPLPTNEEFILAARLLMEAVARAKRTPK